ncbi:MAG: hypothetical protein WBA99_05920 [Nodosilinea sp.]
MIVTGGSIDRLELYRRLEVREVWFWQRVGEASRNENRLALYHRREDARFAASTALIELASAIPGRGVAPIAGAGLDSRSYAQPKPFG